MAFKINMELEAFIKERIQLCNESENNLAENAKFVNTGYWQAMREILELSEVVGKGTEAVQHCVKKEQCPAQDFDIDNIFMYEISKPENVARTRKRLQQIKDIGMSYFNGEFFIEGAVSGLYIERVWNMTDSEFVAYLQWVKHETEKVK